MLLSILFGVTTGPLAAHDGAHVDIQRVTAEIESAATPRPDLHLLRARLLRFHKKPAEALADCDRARDLAVTIVADGGPSPFAPWEEPLERALCYVDLERDDEAAPLLDRVIEAVPDRAAAVLDARATLHVRAGELAAAIADVTRSFTLAPSVDRALRCGALLSEQGALEQAARGYQNALETLGDSLLVKDAWISVEIARGEYETALSLIDAELSRAAVRTSWLVRRAEVYEAAGNEPRRLIELRAALAEADRVLARRRIPMHLVTRGRILLDLGDPEGARRDAKEAKRLAPEFAGVAELLEEIESRGAPPADTPTDARGGEVRSG